MSCQRQWQCGDRQVSLLAADCSPIDTQADEAPDEPRSCSVHDAHTITTPKPPPGSVHVHNGELVVVTAHPGLYPGMVLAATEQGLRTGRRLVLPPAGLSPTNPWDEPHDWDSHVLQAFALVAPHPHPQH